MIKKIILLYMAIGYVLLGVEKDSAEERIKKYNEYKNLVTINREEEIRKNSPSREEVEIQIMKEKFEFEKELALEKEKRERRRDNLINSVIIGGIGYGGYRLGRHHRWW